VERGEDRAKTCSSSTPPADSPTFAWKLGLVRNILRYLCTAGDLMILFSMDISVFNATGCPASTLRKIQRICVVVDRTQRIWMVDRIQRILTVDRIQWIWIVVDMIQVQKVAGTS
jgi:hypothetical protein